MRVYVYRNLHKDVWSVSNGKKVQYRATHLDLSNVTFRVRAGGRAKVLREKKKAVHAFVVGVVEAAGGCLPPIDMTGAVEITYNPYKNETFVRVDGGGAVFDAERVLMVYEGGKARVWGFGLNRKGAFGSVTPTTENKNEDFFGSDRHEVQRRRPLLWSESVEWQADHCDCDGFAYSQQEWEDGRVHSNLHSLC
jgi:hypothetical protein